MPFFSVLPKFSGKRLDLYLVSGELGLTRSQIQRLITTGHVRLNGREIKPASKVLAGDTVSVEIPPPVSPKVTPQKIPLDILYEDRDIIVINKPAGMVVHPAQGNWSGTLVNALLAHCRDLSGIGGELKPGIVHRLDKGTSGVMVAAKNDMAHLNLAQQFQTRSVIKIYWALVLGSPRFESGRLNAPLGRSYGNRKKISSRTRKGREAHTEWRVLERLGPFSLLEIKLKTGRTHQIRAHLSEAGYPVAGDSTYGGVRRLKALPAADIENFVADFSRPALHALKLVFQHPRTGEKLILEAPLAADFKNIIEHCRKFE